MSETKSKWIDLERAINDRMESEVDSTFVQRQLELKLLLHIAKSLDAICNYGIIAYDRA